MFFMSTLFDVGYMSLLFSLLSFTHIHFFLFTLKIFKVPFIVFSKVILNLLANLALPRL